jgi:hypothetical protein
MIHAEAEILAFAITPHRRAKNALGLASRMIARHDSGAGGLRRRLHTDSIE